MQLRYKLMFENNLVQTKTVLQLDITRFRTKIYKFASLVQRYRLAVAVISTASIYRKILSLCTEFTFITQNRT